MKCVIAKTTSRRRALEALKAGENATYLSIHAAEEIQDSITTVIKLDIDQKFDGTSVLSILCDKSTDIHFAGQEGCCLRKNCHRKL